MLLLSQHQSLHMSTDPTRLQETTTSSDDSLGIVFNEVKPQETDTESETPETISSAPSTASTQSDFIPAVNFGAPNVVPSVGASSRRKHRATLAENLSSAAVEWWQTTRKNFEKAFNIVEQKIQKPEEEIVVIEKAQTRSEIIKEAAVFTMQAPKNDHAHIIKHIATAQKENTPIEAAPIVIKQPIQHTSAWAHVEPPVEDSHDITTTRAAVADTILNSVPLVTNDTEPHVTEIPKVLEDSLSEKITAPTPVVPVVSHISIPQEEIIPLITNVVKEPELVSHEAPLEASSVIEAVSHEVETIPAPIVVPVTPAEPAPVEKKDYQSTWAQSSTNKRIAPYQPPLHGTASNFRAPQAFKSPHSFSYAPIQNTAVSQNTVARGAARKLIILSIIFLGAGLGILAKTNFNIFEVVAALTEKESQIIIPSVFKTDTQTAIAFSEDKVSLLSDISAKVVSAPAGVTQFYPVVTTTKGNRSATAEEILTVFNVHLTDKTIRALDDSIIFGSVTTLRNEPFIVLRSFNFDVLFSGFLTWEPYIQSDLSPLITSGGSLKKFTDTTILGKATRIQKDDIGNEVLLYTFVTRDTVVITTSRAALTKILERM